MARKWARKKGTRKPAEHASAEADVKQPGLHIDHAFASSGKTERKFNWRRYTKDKRVVGGAAVLVVIIVGLGLYFGWPEPKVVVPDGCSSQLLGRAAVVLDPTKVGELEPITDEIRQAPKYDQDPNCLYVLVTYYINTSDGTLAKEANNKLEKVYNPEKGYDEAIARDAKSPQALRPSVDFLVKQASRYQNVGPDGAPR
jgi:hypothetical protein